MLEFKQANRFTRNDVVFLKSKTMKLCFSLLPVHSAESIHTLANEDFISYCRVFLMQWYGYPNFVYSVIFKYISTCVCTRPLRILDCNKIKVVYQIQRLDIFLRSMTETWSQPSISNINRSKQTLQFNGWSLNLLNLLDIEN